MRLTLLGTGPAGALPRDGHQDALCRDARQGGKSRRRRSAALLEDGVIILFDAGPDIREQLERHEPRRLDAVFLTHGHSDAVGGLHDLDRWIGRHLGDGPVPIFSDAATVRRLRLKFPDLRRVSLRPLGDFGPQRVGAIDITALPVRHSTTPGFKTRGFLVDGRLGYMSDVAALPPRTRRALAGIDTIILDAAAWFGRPIASHLTADAAIALAASLGSHRLILTQTGHTYPPHARAERAIRAYVWRHGIRSPRHVHLGFDGMTVIVKKKRAGPAYRSR